VQPQLRVDLALEDLAERVQRAQIGCGLRRREHHRRHAAHSNALVALHALDQQGRHIDRVLAVLAAVARERVHGPHADVALRIVEQRDHAGERERVAVVIEVDRAPAAHRLCTGASAGPSPAHTAVARQIALRAGAAASAARRPRGPSAVT
jgi:hypothetical protein